MDNGGYEDPPEEEISERNIITALDEFNIISLYTSIELLFVNNNTIGQVFAYANGLKDGAVEDVTGFYCLGDSYENIIWGQQICSH